MVVAIRAEEPLHVSDRPVSEKIQEQEQADPNWDSRSLDWTVKDKYIEPKLLNEGNKYIPYKTLWYKQDRESPNLIELAREKGAPVYTNTDTKWTRVIPNKPWLFKTLNEKFRSQHKKLILSLQYCKQSRQGEKLMVD